MRRRVVVTLDRPELPDQEMIAKLTSAGLDILWEACDRLKHFGIIIGETSDTTLLETISGVGCVETDRKNYGIR